MQGSEAYRLIVRRGPQPNQVFELTDEVINLGRDITNHIVINDREVSRHHLRLMRGTDGYTVEDLGSTNGTFVDGRRVSGATPLKNGNLLGLGETVTLLYEVAGKFDDIPPEDEQADSAPQMTVPSASGDDPDAMFKPQQPAQPAQSADANPYAGQQAAQPQAAQPAAPYQPPQQPQQPQYAPQPEYQEQQPPANEPYYASAGSGYSPPPPAGYDYDPYAMREDEGGGITQYLLVGCLSLLLLSCCMTVVLAVAVDSLCLYDDVPGLLDVLRAVGYELQGACAP